jgi:CubicO group peptidase (beta-lactamase class C family)
VSFGSIVRLLLAAFVHAQAADTGWRAVDRAVARGIDFGGFPGLAVVVGRKDTTLLERGYGFTDWDHSTTVDPAHTMYDLASVTKVAATTLAAMVLYDRGLLDIDAPVARYLPEWRPGARAGVTVRQLLVHRSGLPAGREVWRVARTPRAARRALLETPLEGVPGARYVYSDVGADIMGFVVERIAHEPLNAFVERHVYRRIGMSETEFRPSVSGHAHRFARTEAPAGRVLDRDAAALGGVAGHAGLFGTAGDLAILARLLLGRGTYHGVRVLSAATIDVFTAPEAGSQALGWELCTGASCGQYMSPRAFGHTGYTGTSMWIDPVHDVFVVVLANWASGTPAHAAGPIAILDDVRADIADLAVATVAGSRGGPIPDAASVAFRSDGARGW